MIGAATGSVLLLVSTGCVLDASRRLAGRLYPGQPLTIGAATTLLSVVAVIAVEEVLGSMGALSPVAVLLVCLALEAAACGRLPGTGSGMAVRLRKPNGAAAWLLAASMIGAGLLVVVAQLDGLLGTRPSYDALDYHLPIAVQWLQSGHVTLLPRTLPGLHEMQFPANYELIELWLLLPVHRDFLVQLASVPALALTGFGVALLASALGARLRLASTAALVVIASPSVLVNQVGGNLTDLFMAGALTTAAGFLARYTSSSRSLDLGLAGLATGVAVGSRYQALVAAIPLLLIGLGFQLQEIRNGARVRTLALQAAAAVGAIGLSGAYFYVRNLVATGDPLFPQRLAFLNVSGAKLDYCCSGPSWVALGWQPHLWFSTAKAMLFTHDSVNILHSWGAAVGVVILATPVPLVLLTRSRQRSPAFRGWALYPLAEFVCYLVTPLSAGYGGAYALINARFLLTTVAASAALLAAAASRFAPRRQDMLAAGILVTTIGSDIVLRAGITRPPLPSAPFLLVFVIPILLMVRALGGTTVALPRRAVHALAMAAAVAAVVASPLIESYYRRHRNMPFETVAARIPASARTIDAVDVCELYPFYGDHLDRRVVSLTGNASVDSPLATTYSRWLRALQTAAVSAVVVRPQPDGCLPGPPPQVAWVSAHPARFQRLTTIDGVTVYRLLSLGR